MLDHNDEWRWWWSRSSLYSLKTQDRASHLDLSCSHDWLAGTGLQIVNFGVVPRWISAWKKTTTGCSTISHSFKADARAAAADHDGFQIYSFSTKQNAVSLSNVTRPDTIFLRSKQLCISLHFQRYVTLLKVCHINRYCCNFKFTNTIINDILLVVLFCLGYVICKKTRLLIVYWSMNGLIQLADPTNQWSVVVCCRWLMCCSPCCPS